MTDQRDDETLPVPRDLAARPDDEGAPEATIDVTLDRGAPDDPIFADAFLMNSLVAGASSGLDGRLAALVSGSAHCARRNAFNNLALVEIWRAEALVDSGRIEDAKTAIGAARTAIDRTASPRKDVLAHLAACVDRVAKSAR